MCTDVAVKRRPSFSRESSSLLVGTKKDLAGFCGRRKRLAGPRGSDTAQASVVLSHRSY